MKKLKFLTLLLIILMVLPACQKENTLDDLVTLDEQVILDDQVAEARNPNPRPFHATFISNQTFLGPNPECGPGPPPFNLLLTQTLSGNATHMGNISGTTSFCILQGSGGATFVAANGDELYFVLVVGNDTLFIEGGTGRFDDATGWVTSEFEEIPPLGPPLMFSNEMDGEIQY